MVANLKVYKNFFLENWREYIDNGYIYSLDEIKGDSQKYSVVIVGFGYSNSKFYWIVQSDIILGEFIRIEFGELGIENVAFAEPFIDNDGKERKEIQLTYSPFESKCDMKISITNLYKNDLEGSFEFIFKNTITSSIFYYQCGTIILPISKTKQINCYYEENKFKYIEEGRYLCISKL